MDQSELTQLIKAEAARLGFDAVAVARATELEAQPLQEWLKRRFHGEMAYLERNFQKRIDPRLIVPGAQSVISLALNYYHAYPLPYADPSRGVISRYSSGDDYHDAIKQRLRELYGYIQQLSPSVEGRYYVDTGPVLDKVWAQRSGIGWIGKHTNVIAKRRFGSWLFLAEIIVTLELEPDHPATDHCGSCTRCIEACPTDAIVEPYVLDSRRCISYLTIELRGDIPEEFREAMGNLIFGCDICQDVCPWNRKSEASQAAELAPREANRAPQLKHLARMSEDEFRLQYRGSPIKRTKWRGFMRNLAVAMGNSGDPAMLQPLSWLLQSPDSMVRRHAAWGLAQLGTPEAAQHLRKRAEVEPDPGSRSEILRQLERVRDPQAKR